MKILNKSELSLYLDHLLRLSDDDRYLRFAGKVSEYSIEKYVLNINLDKDYLIGTFSENKIIGALHLSECIENKKIEMALSVESEFRGKGIGTELFNKAIILAKEKGYSKIYTLCLSHNSWMMRKAKELQMDITISYGEVQAEKYINQ